MYENDIDLESRLCVRKVIQVSRTHETILLILMTILQFLGGKNEILRIARFGKIQLNNILFETDELFFFSLQDDY